ncbi:unnamed protein product [Calypogeia fissa]
MTTSKVVELVVVNRVEVGNSVACEHTGVRRASDQIPAAGIMIDEVVHDHNTTVDAYVMELGIENQKDLWHKCKSLLKNLNKTLANEKETSPTGGVNGAVSMVELGRCTVQQLKDWLKDKNLPYSFGKSELVHRVARLRELPEEDIMLSNSKPFKYPEINEKHLGDKLKSWFYKCCQKASERGDDNADLLAREIVTAADHWAGLHEVCKQFLPRKCCEPDAVYTPYYEVGGATHLALRNWLRKNVTASSVRFYTRARANFLCETFHSIVNKYATKRIHFGATHEARMACAAMCWNKNINREVVRIRNRTPSNTSVRDRPQKVRDLVDKTTAWKKAVSDRIFELKIPNYDS